MAKVSGYLYGATGKLGSATLYTAGGKTIIREARSSAKDAKTFAQMIQRVIAKTAMNQYSALQDIANHSFQGKAAGQQCMSRFLSRNMNYFRERAAEIQQAGGSIYAFLQFAAVGSTKYTPAAVIISEGKLSRIITSIKVDGSHAFINVPSGTTYKALADTLNAKRGDQLTFITIEKNTSTGDYIPHVSRVILDPRNDDGSAADWAHTDFCGQNAVVKPNMRNKGNFQLLEEVSPGVLNFNIAGGLVTAAGCILSRKVNGQWLRSSCKLVLNESILGYDAMSLGAAVDASLASNEIYTDDDLYLNNAGTGGAQGVAESPAVGSLVTVSNIVSINGVDQDVSGGSVQVSALDNLTVYGTGLTDGYIKVQREGEQEATSLIAVSNGRAAYVSMGGIIPNSETVYHVTKNNEAWFDMIDPGTIQGLE